MGSQKIQSSQYNMEGAQSGDRNYSNLKLTIKLRGKEHIIGERIDN